jgi:hypothetical protein
LHARQRNPTPSASIRVKATRRRRKQYYGVVRADSQVKHTFRELGVDTCKSTLSLRQLHILCINFEGIHECRLKLGEPHGVGMLFFIACLRVFLELEEITQQVAVTRGCVGQVAERTSRGRKWSIPGPQATARHRVHKLLHLTLTLRQPSADECFLSPFLHTFLISALQHSRYYDTHASCHEMAHVSHLCSTAPPLPFFDLSIEMRLFISGRRRGVHTLSWIPITTG